MTWSNQRNTVREAVAQFPATFGLSTYEGTYRIAEESSYVNDDGDVQLVTQVLRDGVWLDFIRCYIAELSDYIRPLPVMTDAAITEAVSAMVPYEWPSQSDREVIAARTTSEYATKQITVYVSELVSISDALKLAEEMLTHIRNGGSYDTEKYIESLLTIRNASDSASLYRRDAIARV